MQEAGVILDRLEQSLYWHTPEARTSVSLPDSQALWEALWQYRDELSGFAHTHPGSGLPVPSQTDVTTFSAIERGLGQSLDWWILSADYFVRYRSNRPWGYSVPLSPPSPSRLVTPLPPAPGDHPTTAGNYVIMEFGCFCFEERYFQSRHPWMEALDKLSRAI